MRSFLFAILCTCNISFANSVEPAPSEIADPGVTLIRYTLDESDRQALLRQSPHTMKTVDKGRQLSVADIKNLHYAGIHSEIIIALIETSGTQFHLTTSDIIQLRNMGVAQNVIDLMLRTGN